MIRRTETDEFDSEEEDEDLRRRLFLYDEDICWKNGFKRILITKTTEICVREVERNPNPSEKVKKTAQKKKKWNSRLILCSLQEMQGKISSEKKALQRMKRSFHTLLCKSTQSERTDPLIMLCDADGAADKTSRTVIRLLGKARKPKKPV